jgi:hypothetical protein
MTLPRLTRSAGALVLAAWLAACGTQPKAVTRSSRDDAALGRIIGRSPRTTDARGDNARAAARAFLTSYLDVSYGRAEPGELRSATRALREGLRAEHARVPAGVRNRRPRIAALHLEAIGDRRLRATATVDDGDVAPYPLFATLARRTGGRWVAVSVGG